MMPWGQSINYSFIIEQQNDSEFDENDYKNLKKYKQKIERRIFFFKNTKKKL